MARKGNPSRALRKPRQPSPRRTPGELFNKLVRLQARLRAPDGCPWDREQTPQTLRTFLIEETYEVLDALESGASDELAGELGDLLLQIIFHALMASEAGQFDISDVIQHVHDKMVRRHPHVFGNTRARNATEVLRNWEQIKAGEREALGGKEHSTKAPPSLLDGIPRSLPALLEAAKLTRRAAHIGFDWAAAEDILDKVHEECAEVQAALAPARGHSSAATATRDATARKHRGAHAKTTAGPPTQEPDRKHGGEQIPDPALSARNAAHLEDEAGDLLFAAVNVARFLGIDPEIALKKANRKFSRRFRWMELKAARSAARSNEPARNLASLPREEMERLWNRAKAAESGAEHADPMPGSGAKGDGTGPVLLAPPSAKSALSIRKQHPSPRGKKRSKSGLRSRE